jgi:gamma-glutamyltranspeptidase/glutathione hydrolase
MMLRIFGHGQNPQAAADAPRWQVLAGRDLALEPGATPETLVGLRARGHRFQELPPLLFGGAQLVYRLERGYVAGSEPRKDGHAVVF